MRWIFPLLLLANAVYFVWQNPLESVNKTIEVMPESVAGLRLLSEIDASLLLSRGSGDSIVDERSSGGAQVIEALTEDDSLDEQSLEVGSSESGSLKESSLNRGSLEDLPAKASRREIRATDESFVLLNMLVDDQPVADQPVTDQPVTDQPVADQPVTDQPVTDQPGIEQPVTDQPVIDQPVSGQPVSGRPAEEQWCQVVSGLQGEGDAQRLLDALLKAGLSAEVKASDIETVLAFELIMDKPAVAGDNAALMDDFTRLGIQSRELLLNGMAVYVLGRFDSRNEVDEVLSRLEGELTPRIYQVVRKDSYFEVWVQSDEGAKTSNEINLLASVYSPEIKIEKKVCKGVASAGERD